MSEKKQYTSGEVLNLQSQAYQKGLNEGYQLKKQEQPRGAGWVKASEQKPDHFKVDFKDKHGNEFKGNYSKETGQYYAYGFTQAINDVIEWKRSDESPAEQPVDDNYDTLYYIVLPALHKLRHRTDNDTRMLAMGSDIRNTIHNTIAEIKKLPQPKSANEPPFLIQSEAAEQPGREVDDLKTFLHWLTRDSFLELIGGQWTAKNDEDGTCPFSQERIIEMFKDQ